MRQSKLFTKTSKQVPSDETSINAQLLLKAGFVHKEMAGVYAYLPLGLRVLKKINQVIREEMDAVGGQEIQLTALQEKETWEKTNRWSDEVVDNWFKTQLKNGSDLGLAFTHEEPLTKLLTKYVSSYKDLPFYPYQIQTKFRNEKRAKAGLIRGREFLMKDLYSFSRSKEEHEAFYEKMKDVYMNVFNRLGLGENTFITISSGGSFSKYSYEFQTVCESGEDTIYIDEEKKLAINEDDFDEETVKDFGFESDKKKLRKEKSIEVGDIYSLGYKFSDAFDLSFTNEEGESEKVYMGSYGMSPTRLMGTVVELNNDKNGMIWPKALAPFAVHMISLSSGDDEVQSRIDNVSEDLYKDLEEVGVEVLWDDREDMSPGAKFGDADLIGIPLRLVISEKTLKEDSVEWKERSSKDMNLIKLEAIKEAVENWVKE